jgi:hypothetical protein
MSTPTSEWILRLSNAQYATGSSFAIPKCAMGTVFNIIAIFLEENRASLSDR